MDSLYHCRRLERLCSLGVALLHCGKSNKVTGVARNRKARGRLYGVLCGQQP